MRAAIYSTPIVLAATFAFAAPHPKGSPISPRLNALDLEEGALLVQEPASAAVAIADGSVWHLTDGRDDAGWRSPDGAPQGASFVWELDALWRLDTLLLSTKGIDERREPGVAAKTIELFVAGQQGDWTSVGQFTVGARERREVRLPAGTTAARVRAIILDNHGDTSASALSEVSIYGERVGSIATAPLIGDFRTSLGALRFIQGGDRISGCFDTEADPIMLTGTLTGRVARVHWNEPTADGAAERTATFAFSADTLRGTTYTDGQPDGVLSGLRVPPSRGPRCVPTPVTEGPVVAQR